MADSTNLQHPRDLVPDSTAHPSFTPDAQYQLFGPALPDSPRADVTGAFPFGRRGRAYLVDVVVNGPVRIKTLVYQRRTTFAHLCGELGVEILDQDEAEAATVTALEAVDRAAAGLAA